MWPWLLTISRGMTGTLWWTNITDSIGSWSRSAMVVKPCNWTLTEFVLLTLCHSFKCRCLRFQKPLVWPSSRKAISRISLTDPKIKTTKGPFQINTIICQRWCQLVVAKRLKRGMPNRRVHSILLKMVAYCESDLKLLKEGCLKFKQLFEEKAKFNPFSYMTIASACNPDLRQNRMEANTIASEPLHGWRINTNYSYVSLEWLHWEDSKLHRIQHARNVGEFRIPNSNYTADGYDDVT